jgi:hypothetical protein
MVTKLAIPPTNPSRLLTALNHRLSMYGIDSAYVVLDCLFDRNNDLWHIQYRTSTKLQPQWEYLHDCELQSLLQNTPS